MLTDQTLQLAASLAAKLTPRGLTLSAAESCTGGGLAYALTTVPGSSFWFKGSVVTYSNELKHRWLGVSNELLERHGAVSENCVLAMVDGVCKMSECDVAVAISGVAGPDGGTDAKPIGYVCFAWRCKDKIYSDTQQFSGDREAVRRQSIEWALQRLINIVDKG